MGSVKSGLALVLMVAAVIVSMSEKGSAQNGCSIQLSSLNVCAPYVVPGTPSTNPSTECCSALERVGHDCLCNTIRIASQLPSLCQIPRVACDAN